MTPTDPSPPEVRQGQIILTAIPLAAAIGVFGTIFGAAATPLLGPALTIAASVLIFSGTVQLTLVGLLLTGSSALALLATAIMLNLRNPLLGAVVRPHLAASWPRRALLAWFVIDETVGLALAHPRQATSTLLSAGSLAYVSWIAGTVLGAAGGALAGLRPLAAAMFPVAFIGLAALAATRRDLVIRAIVAALLAFLLSTFLPIIGSLAPVVAAILVALPGKKE